MTSPAASAQPVAPALAPDARPARARPTPATLALGRAILGHALLVGIAGDALLRGGPGGLAWPLWIAVFVLAVPSLVWRAGRVVPREARAWLGAALLFAAAMAWRDSETLAFFDFLATAGALAMAAVALGAPGAALFAERLRDTVWAGMRVAVGGLVGMPIVALRQLEAPNERGRVASTARAAVRATLIVGVLGLVFGSLLRDADPIFASLVALPDLDVGELASHVLFVGALAWLATGWAFGALLDPGSPRAAPAGLPFGLGRGDVTAALGTLVVLFGAYVATQLGWFFGGEQFLHARTGLTAAAYARGGFFQMVAVVALVVPLLLATRAALRPGLALERRHTALALPVLALLGVMILSAVLRLRLYVHYYGLTTDRLYPLVFMGWLALVLAWLARTVLRGWNRPFVGGAVISGLVTLAALNVASPDAIVARVNVARAAGAAPGSAIRLDLPHLASLSGEAADLAVGAVLAAPAVTPAPGVAADSGRCIAARRLLRRWGPGSRAAALREEEGAWRTWNAGEARALRVVDAHALELARIGAPCRPRPAAVAKP